MLTLILYVLQFRAISARGTRAMFHSALVFIIVSLLVLFICTASVICLNIPEGVNVVLEGIATMGSPIF